MSDVSRHRWRRLFRLFALLQNNLANLVFVNAFIACSIFLYDLIVHCFFQRCYNKLSIVSYLFSWNIWQLLIFLSYPVRCINWFAQFETPPLQSIDTLLFFFLWMLKKCLPKSGFPTWQASRWTFSFNGSCWIAGTIQWSILHVFDCLFFRNGASKMCWMACCKFL